MIGLGEFLLVSSHRDEIDGDDIHDAMVGVPGASVI